jgi:hypothetical protein
MAVYTCNSDGTLSLLTQLTIPNYFLSSFESYHNVCVDTLGLVRVTFASRYGSNYVPMETRYDGSSFSNPIKVTGDTELCNTTLPLTLVGGNIGVMYNNNTTTPRFSYGCDTWTAQNPSVHLAMRSAEEWCAVGDGNNSVYMVYATQTGLVISIWLRKFYMGLGWTAPKLITSGNIGGPTGTAPVHPRITMDLYGNTYVFWVVNSRYVWYVKVLSIVGLNSGTLLTPILLADEGATSNISQMQLPEIMNAIENIGVAWTTNLTIRFTFLNPVTPPQPPIWAVSEGEYDRAFDTFPSYVRVGTFHNRRTRRGLCAV